MRRTSRYSAGEPVSARPPGFFYVTGKFIQRNRLRVLLASAAVLSLITLTVIAWHERRLAEERYADMRATTTSLLFELKEAINDVPGSTSAQEILVKRALKNLDRLAGSSNPGPCPSP